jgi:hypothetical protein
LLAASQPFRNLSNSESHLHKCSRGNFKPSTSPQNMAVRISDLLNGDIQTGTFGCGLRPSPQKLIILVAKSIIRFFSTQV